MVSHLVRVKPKTALSDIKAKQAKRMNNTPIPDKILPMARFIFVFLGLVSGETTVFNQFLQKLPAASRIRIGNSAAKTTR